MAADQYADITDALASGDLDPYEAVDRLLAAIVPTDGRPETNPADPRTRSEPNPDEPARRSDPPPTLDWHAQSRALR